MLSLLQGRDISGDRKRRNRVAIRDRFAVRSFESNLLAVVGRQPDGQRTRSVDDLAQAMTRAEDPNVKAHIGFVFV